MGFCNTLSKDIENIIESNIIPWEEYKGSNIMVSGATGLVGSLLCISLLSANKKYNLGLNVFAVVRNEQKAESVFYDLIKDESFVLVKGDICSELNVKESIDYIFHCASVTTSKYMVSNPVETIETSIFGTHNILKFASEKNVKSFIYLSSMEMYGTFDSDIEVRENNIGYLDPLAIRSNYPECKRLCENMCEAFYSEYNVPIRIARLSQMFGAGVRPDDNRVFAQFAKAVIMGEDIVLHTKGLSEGNYCYTTDSIKALLLIAVKGEPGEAYNVVNPTTHTTIANMANMIANEIAKGNIKVVFDIPEENIYGYATETRMKLNSDKLQSLGWKPEIDLKTAYERLIQYYREVGI